MNEDFCYSRISSLIPQLPQDVRMSAKLLMEILLSKVFPYLQKIGINLQLCPDGVNDHENKLKIRHYYYLCGSQIKKCIITMVEIFKLEHQHNLLLQESRQCTMERLLWCCNRLATIETKLEMLNQNCEDNFNDSILSTPMYFVTWIDQTYDILLKMTNLVYSSDSKSSELFHQWDNEMIESVISLHTSIDELLLSAMTLCRYCLVPDQHIIRARCQVVLREMKALLNDVIENDLDTVTDSTSVSLKLPITPLNVNVLIDVLKDALYVLETNTNTALLALLVHCFSNCTSPIDVLISHFSNNNNGICGCIGISSDDITETCSFIKDFDLHNERLLQIGTYAVSSSSDQKRILTLRSCLASLEALDPHLVPALVMAPESQHAKLLINSWIKEVSEIRDNVFLIVDPAEFADKAKQMMHKILLDIIKEHSYDNCKTCTVINIGCVVHQFYSVYLRVEPDALSERDKLLPLLSDLYKAQIECKIVSDHLCSGTDFVYKLKKIKSENNISIEQLKKRLKLLYTLVHRINVILHPETDHLENEEEPYVENLTYEVAPRKGPNCDSKSFFGRTTNIRTPAKKLPLFVLTKHLREKKMNNRSFSVILDNICNDTDFKVKSFRNSLTFFYSPLRRRPSLRREMLKRQKLNVQNELESDHDVGNAENSFMDESVGEQITDVLDKITDLTNNVSIKGMCYPDATRNENFVSTRNILRNNVNDRSTTVTKHILNVQTLASDITKEPNVTVTSDISQSSNVTTLERLNDLDLVESKISNLRFMQLETSL